MSWLKNDEPAFGFDISDQHLRLVQLCKKGKRILVRLHNDVRLPCGCVVDGEIRDRKVFLEHFNKLVRTRIGHGRLSREVVCSLPESKTFLKQISLDTADEEATEAKVREAIPLHFPLSADEVYFDWQVISKDDCSSQVLVGASPKAIVDSYMDAIEAAGFMPAALEVEAAAISRLLIESNGGQEPQIAIDIGATRTGLFLYDEGTVKFTISLPISGEKATQTIIRALDLDPEKAEKAKLVCGLDPDKCQGALLEVFSDIMDELCARITSAIDFYHDNFHNDRPISRITLCGGGANFIGIAQFLSHRLDIEVAIADPFAAIDNPDPKHFTPQQSQSYVTAMGLALKGLNR